MKFFSTYKGGYIELHMNIYIYIYRYIYILLYILLLIYVCIELYHANDLEFSPLGQTLGRGGFRR